MALDLHHAARECLDSLPDLQEHLNSTKPDRLVIAVERHDKQNPQWKIEDKDRFLWIKGRTKVTIGQVRQSYIAQYQQTEPTLRISLAENAFVGLDLIDPTKTGDLDTLSDRLIVLAAVKKSASHHAEDSATVGCQAAYPTSVAAKRDATPKTPGHSSNATGLSPGKLAFRSGSCGRTPTRQPLQPVNRQLSVPLQRSQESDISLKRSQDSDVSKPEPPSPKDDSSAGNESVAEDEPGAEAEGAASQDQEYQPKDYGDLIKTTEDQEEPTVRGLALRELTQNSVPERLEAGVRTGLKVLTNVQTILQRLEGGVDAQNWCSQIETVRKEAVRSRTVVGVVGGTGAGKSSVINAMLDEERLVPTNCMRACTAVVTELSYNDSASEQAKYRAEVVFIKPEEWRRELTVLVNEIFDDEGNLLRDSRDSDSPAGVAYAKVRAVYHKHTNEMLGKATVDSLMRVKSVQSILGTTKKIAEASPDKFYKRLQHYVDSKEKGTEKLDKNGNKLSNPKRDLEYWPLIKVVKIYTKADALSTGAVIVDLPGVQDSNAARAAVAEGYMKQCSGLWIVAPINRAVDDKAAKSLLGDTFKRQLKYDGAYSAVTFICSKTDDISKTEATDSLKLNTEMGLLENRAMELERQRKDLNKRLKAAKDSKLDCTEAIETIDDQLEIWETLQTDVESGSTIFAPSARKKRTRPSSSPVSRKKKRRRISLSDDDDDYAKPEAEPDNVNDEQNEAEIANREPLTQDQVEQKLDELKRMKREARRRRIDIDNEIRDLSTGLGPIETEEAEVADRQDELVIAGRNEYSRSAIRQDFAAGIKELDQENAEEEDPDNFNPEEDIRDYDEVSRSLPVFCVSSRAYQKLSGRLQKDNEVCGFTNKEQTEIPQLQAHCKKLTVNGRQATCRRFLNSLSQLLASLSLWASDDGTGLKLTAQQRDVEKVFIHRRLKELEKALETAVKDKLNDIKETLDEVLFTKFEPAIASAATEAIPTATRWGAHRNAGGLHHGTYKATVRRQGVFRSDFNQELFEPIQKQLASAWEKAFQRRLPHILQTFTKTGTDLLKKFHSAVEARCREKGHGVARLGVLSNQLQAYQAIFSDMVVGMIGIVNEGQRNSNREFTPVIAEAMNPVYDRCAGETGSGMFIRMKGHMTDHVDQNKATMFSSACEQVRNSLSDLINDVHAQMLKRADDVFERMRQDYLSIIGGVNVRQVTMPREERALRREIDEIISAMDVAFEKVVECDVDELEVGTTVAEDTMEIDDQDDVDNTTSEQDEENEEAGASSAEYEDAHSEVEHSDDAEEEDEDYHDEEQ